MGTLCLGAALFLLALVYDRTHQLDEINEKLDRLLGGGGGEPAPLTAVNGKPLA